jgi:thiamine-monophosphate kinase
LNREEYFIKHISNSSLQGDDGAFSDGYVYSKDAFFENVHFKKEWMSYKEIAIKASLVNISDAIAMNAKPKYALISIAMPKTITKKDIKELTDGFLEMADKYGYEIIGGDTVANIKLDISMTFISETKNPIFRDTLKNGDFIAYTGELGSVSRDLKTLLRGNQISKTSKFITPNLKDKFFYKASRYINSSLDISDGLFKELSRLSSVSNYGIKLFKPIEKRVGCSGEEYEILFTFSKNNLAKIQNISKQTRTKINIIGKVVRGNKFISPCKNNHF